jgi:cytochrome c biogenesis protein CcmG, thiol:disulfide interchange protein DsbE
MTETRVLTWVFFCLRLSSMTWFRAVALCVLMIGAMWLGWVKYSAFLSRGQEAPESAKVLDELERSGFNHIRIPQLAGGELSLADFSGRLVILNFWASWCEPCVQEFPSMLKLVREMNGKVVLVAVSGDESREDIDIFLKAFAVSKKDVVIGWDRDQELAKKLGTFKLPESFVIGPKGELVRKVAGVADWHSPEAVEFFKQRTVGLASQ